MALKRTILERLKDAFAADNVTRVVTKYQGWSEVYQIENPSGLAWEELADGFDNCLEDRAVMKSLGNRGMQIIVSLKSEEGEEKYSSMSFARNPGSSFNHAHADATKYAGAYHSSYVVAVYLYLR